MATLWSVVWNVVALVLVSLPFLVSLGFLIYCVKGLGYSADHEREVDFFVMLAGTIGVFCLTLLFLWPLVFGLWTAIFGGP